MYLVFFLFFSCFSLSLSLSLSLFSGLRDALIERKESKTPRRSLTFPFSFLLSPSPRQNSKLSHLQKTRQLVTNLKEEEKKQNVSKSNKLLSLPTLPPPPHPSSLPLPPPLSPFSSTISRLIIIIKIQVRKTTVTVSSSSKPPPSP